MESWIIDRPGWRLRFWNGRIDLNLGGQALTGAQGLRAFVEGDGVRNDSTEADWILRRADDTGMEADGLLRYFPLRLVWRIQGAEKGGVSMTLHIDGPIREKVRAAGLSLDLHTLYIGAVVEGHRVAFPTQGPTIGPLWCTSVESGDARAIPPFGQAFPAVRLHRDGGLPGETFSLRGSPGARSRCCLEWMTGLSTPPTEGGDAAPTELFRGCLDVRREPPPPFRFPEDLFQQGPVRQVLVIADTDIAHAQNLGEALIDRLGRIQEGEASEPVRLIFFGSRPRLLDFLRAFSSRWRGDVPELLAQTVEGLERSFGRRTNLYALLSGVRTKMKLDRMGGARFYSNSPLEILRRKWTHLRERLKQ